MISSRKAIPTEKEIISLRDQIRDVRSQRSCERKRFAENQHVLAKRQNFCRETIQRLLEPKTSIPCRYSQTIQKLSQPNEPSYIVSTETKVCHALHQIEIKEQQLRVLKRNQQSMKEFLTKTLKEEIRLGADTEKILLDSIKSIGDEMAGIILRGERASEKGASFQGVNVSTCLKSIASNLSNRKEKIKESKIFDNTFIKHVWNEPISQAVPI